MLNHTPTSAKGLLSLGLLLVTTLLGCSTPATAAATAAADAGWRSPNGLVASQDADRLFVTGATARALFEVDAASQKVTRRIDLPAPPTGLALSADGRSLWVTCSAPGGTVCRVDLAEGSIAAQHKLGHTPVSPVPSADGSRLYVCLRFLGQVVTLDAHTGAVLQRVAVPREPWSADLTRNGRHLLVAHHLPDGPSSANRVAADLSVIDTEAGRVVKSLELPNGSTLLRDLRVSPDGKLAAVVHSLARFQLPTTQLERGWMNTSAVTLIDLASLSVINSVLLDEVDYGAANPWGVAWTADSRRLLVTHAGTHELSVIDIPGLLAKLAKLPPERPTDRTLTYISASASAKDVPNDLAFLVGLRTRIKLQGNGPRAVAVRGSQAWVADYFTDTLEVVNLNAKPLRPALVSLGPTPEPTLEREGERLFNDATICFQQWQSCASCHSEDARIDGLNWDLLNDGLGNPKNSKNLLLAPFTPPAMSLGVREDAETAVRAGLRHALFAVRPESEAEALDAYLSSLKPVPGPAALDPELAESARRGQALFGPEQLDCVFCHQPARHFVDGQQHDVGSAGPLDREAKKFDTPTLVEIWRTAPYLHDGSARTLREVLVDRNPDGKHGRVRDLSPAQLEDLLTYLKTL